MWFRLSWMHKHNLNEGFLQPGPAWVPRGFLSCFLPCSLSWFRWTWLQEMITKELENNPQAHRERYVQLHIDPFGKTSDEKYKRWKMRHNESLRRWQGQVCYWVSFLEIQNIFFPRQLEEKTSCVIIKCKCLRIEARFHASQSTIGTSRQWFLLFTRQHFYSWVYINVITWSNIQVRRIKEIVTKDKVLWWTNKLPQIVPEGDQRGKYTCWS